MAYRSSAAWLVSGAVQPPVRSGGLFLRRAEFFEFAFPLHFGCERLAFLRAHEHGLFLTRIRAAHDVFHVARDHIFHDRDEVGVNARVTRNVLLPKMEEIR